ncbi:hypothetical protein Pta6605_54880 [Pseudomonas amygdali pv. tabaci]|nr:hypothetical protein Pta6605_54880 [Pseudomonas amygdali pv. tabaci]
MSAKIGAYSLRLAELNRNPALAAKHDDASIFATYWQVLASLSAIQRLIGLYPAKVDEEVDRCANQIEKPF